MNKQCLTWKLVAHSLRQDIPVMLLYVLESRGSSPGRQGFSMALAANGSMEGSIGGGIMEHKLVEMAKEQLQQAITKTSIRKQVHHKTATKNQSGMICSGEQTILLYRVQQKDLPAIQLLIASLEQNRNGLLQLSAQGIQFYEREAEKEKSFVMRDENDWLYEEKTGYRNRLYIIGGGHCSLALSALMSAMDFYITVFDDRQELHTLSQNVFAHEKLIVEDYQSLADMIPAGKDDHYVVIMTVGYRTDDIALRSLWQKEFRYLAVLGSRHKIQEMFNVYIAEGIPPERLQKIHAPAGVAIKSQTPEEIAVSIAAEIIREKNSNGDRLSS